MDLPIIDQLSYTDKQKEYLKRLYRDNSCRADVQKAIGNQLAASDTIILGNSLNQLCLLTCQAQFADSDEETVAVAVIIMVCLKVADPLPSLLDHRGKAFAARSLVSLGMFRKAMEERCNKHGAPSPDYYRKVGQLYFKQENLPDIAAHFIPWENFLSERFV